MRRTTVLEGEKAPTEETLVVLGLNRGALKAKISVLGMGITATISCCLFSDFAKLQRRGVECAEKGVRLETVKLKVECLLCKSRNGAQLDALG